MVSFDNPLALLALLSIIPLIILYLLKPKPKIIKVPSLLFLMKVENNKKRFYSSLTKIIKDPLFWVQLFVLILLSLAAASPYFTTDEPLSQEHTVLIIDSSASMQANNIYQDALNHAEAQITRTNTIILASNTPEIVLNRGSSTDTRRVLNQLSPNDVIADVSSAMNRGVQEVSEHGGKIVVISDFTNWDGEDPVITKSLIESYGIEVEFINVGRSTGNVGFINGWIDLTADGYTYRGIIKNYYDRDITIDLAIFNQDDEVPFESKSLTIPEKQTRQFSIPALGPGITRVEIENEDSFMVDNIAYISVPREIEQNVLLISDQDKLPSKTALSIIPNVRLSIADTVPSELGTYDAIIVANKEKDGILTNHEVNAVENYVKQGGSAIFVASEALDPNEVATDLLRLLPVRVGDVVDKPRGVTLNKLVTNRLTEDINFEEVAVYKYLEATPRSGANVLVETDDGTPIYSHHSLDQGTVIYIGFNDGLKQEPWNNFHNLPEYPVFWSKLINWIGGTGTISDFNVETGTVVSFRDTQTIKTPNTEIETNRIQMNTVGVYEIGAQNIVANLYSESESDTTKDGSDVMNRVSEQDTETEPPQETMFEIKNFIDDYLIYLVILLIILEIIIVKRRGEL
ncbi:vWA domain-containing protein [Methanosalsum natronophilum]|uniref:vWA domain-containing protein n=1 Tax=Methanosalsum natronophilum TaxID=768733 RepID=UPI002169DE44|nr:VWA domain-containing protein [Methanosalsum natronophilum]MCS3924705.1 hypothetical protein [Methanosalsum natronophilum]